MRRAAFLIVAAGLFAGAALPATAQFQQSLSRPYNGGGFGTGSPNYGGWNGSYPALSPYLDIVRGGNPAINYQLGTRAEVDRRVFEGNVLNGNLPGFGFGVGGAGQGDDVNPIPSLSQTGHLSSFNTFGTYFNYQGYGIGIRPYYPLNPMQSRAMPR